MRKGSDPRYNTRRWRKLRLQVLNRDLWQCIIRGEHCRGNADQADHIISPNPWLGGGAFFDMDNLRAACAPCNNGRNNPANQGGFFSGGVPVDSPPSNLSPLSVRFGPVSSVYSRKPAESDDAA